MNAPSASRTIWLWALGYFLAYAPYSALTKALSTGALGTQVSGSAILPLATFASVIGMPIFLAATGWWRSAAQYAVGPFSLPGPTRWTLMSGLCSAAIITTTTLAYAFDGVSIVLMMLLMRGGVLLIAPIVDKLSGRPVSGRNWVALGFTFAALFVAVGDPRTMKITSPALLDAFAYVAAYFVRLRFMSKMAKATSPEASRKYFVEEQLVAAPAALAGLAVLALIGQGETLHQIRLGFTDVPFSASLGVNFAIGVCSFGTGVFGALVLLDHRSNSFTVPVNRASSVLAGVVATVALHVWLGLAQVDPRELFGAGLVMVAIVVLSLPPGRPARAAESAPPPRP